MADHFYISPVNGNDGNAGTSEGAAKATIQAALDLTALTPNATVFHLGNSGDHAVSTSLYWTNGTGTKWTYQRPVVFLPWDEGVSGVNYRTINGVSTPEAVINLTTTGDLFSENPNYCTWLNAKIVCDGSAGTLGALYLGTYCYCDGVIIHNSDATYGLRMTTGGLARNCAITSDGTYYPDYAYSLLQSKMESCFSAGSRLNTVQYATYGVEGSVFKNWGISNSTFECIAANSTTAIKNCAFIGNDNVGGNAITAIEASTQQLPIVYNSIFMYLEHGGQVNTSFDSGFQLVGYNAFYDVTYPYYKDAPPQTYGWDTASIIDLSNNDIALTEDPFVDSANNDFNLKSNSILRGRGVVFPINYAGIMGGNGSKPQRCDIGPVQYGEPNLPYAGYRS